MATQRLERITERDAKAAQPGDVLSEKCTRGLLLQVSPGGVRSWVFRYRGHPQPGLKTLQRSKGLGNWPGVSIAMARDQANKTRAMVSDDKDPLEEQRKEAERRLAAKARAEARQTFTAAAERFYDAVIDTKYRRKKNAQRLLAYAGGTEVSGRLFRKLLVVEITPEIAQELHGLLSRERGEILANRVVSGLNRFWKWAAKPGGVPDVRGLPSPFGSLELNEETSRGRVLSDDELGAIWEMSAQLQWWGCAFVRLLILTGCRGGEILGLRWQPAQDGRFGHVDLKAGLLVFPSGATKNRQSHVVYLNDTMREVLQGVPRQFQRPFLLSLTGTKPAAFRHTLKTRIDTLLPPEQMPGGPWTFHDLRRSFVTGMSDLEVAEHVTKKLINHTGQKTAFDAYSRSAHEKPRRAALEAWAAHVTGLISQPAAKSA